MAKMLVVQETENADFASAWAEASQEHRNRLARELFEAVWSRDERVVAVRSRPELRPFFQISEECQTGSLSGDPDRSRAVKTDFFMNVLPTVPSPRGRPNGRYMYQSRVRLTREQATELQRAHRTGGSLRSLARSYGVSHETVRQAILATAIS